MLAIVHAGYGACNMTLNHSMFIPAACLYYVRYLLENSRQKQQTLTGCISKQTA